MSSDDRLAPAFWWVGCAALAVIVRLLSPGILEGGDGVQHYQIAHFAWKHPELFLHHWGKPLFTLFASPFAQLGHWGMCLFNALCFVVTCWAADAILKRAGHAARWLFPPALLLVPVYGSMVLAGMTEVFFAMLAMLVVRALFDQRYVMAMIVVSFIPFARPEYIAFAPFAIALVVWKRQWRALPFTLIGHAVYAVIGGEVFGDLLWVFHQDPYTGAEGIYGKGPLLYFTDHIQNIFGWPLIWALGCALVFWVVLFIKRRDDRPTLLLLAFLALLPALAILATHSVLWWKGLKGSLGLFRVLATCAPLVVLCACWPLTRWSAIVLRSRLIQVIATVILGSSYVVFATLAFLLERPLPVQTDGYERFVQAVGAHVGTMKADFTRVVYLHPYIGYAAGVDPFDQQRSLMGMDRNRPDLGLRTKDLVVWDAHFGPNEGGLPIERLLNDPGLVLLEVRVPEERFTVLGGYPFEVYLFTPGHELRDTVRSVLVAPDTGVMTDDIAVRMDTLPCGMKSGTRCFGAGEYPFEATELRFDQGDMIYAELTVIAELTGEAATSGSIDLVFTEESNTGKVSHWSQPLTAGPFRHTFRIPRRTADHKGTLYIWNHSGKDFRLTDLRIEVVRIGRKR